MNKNIAFIVGAFTFSLLQSLWAVGHAYGVSRSAWIMKTAPGILLCFAVFFVVAAIVAARYRDPNQRARGRGPMIVGAVAAMVVALMIIGPGNLWPLVIAFAGTIISVAVLVGAGIGAAFRHPEGEGLHE